MSDSPVSYRSQQGVATITMDDGKRNALSPRMFEELNKAFESRREEDAIVILTGREEVFSAGFDLKVLRAGNMTSLALMRAGFLFAARMLGHPRPVISVCTGHALAMGAFLLLASDYRIGTEGPYKFATNEVAIGIPMPRSGVELCRQRLAPAHFHRAAILAETYNPRLPWKRASSIGWYPRRNSARRRPRWLARSANWIATPMPSPSYASVKRALPRSAQVYCSTCATLP